MALGSTWKLRSLYLYLHLASKHHVNWIVAHVLTGGSAYLEELSTLVTTLLAEFTGPRQIATILK